MPGIAFGGGGSSSLATASSFITASLGLTENVITEVTSVDLTAGTWLVLATALNSTESLSTTVDIWLDSVSGAKSASPYGGSGLTQNAAGITSYAPETGITIIALITLTTDQTVYMNAVAVSQAGSLAAVNGQNVGGATGMVAIQTGT